MGAAGANTQSTANGINDSSWIVGTVNGEASVWTPQTGLQAVGFLGSGNSSGFDGGISNADVAVGGSTTLGGSDSHAIIWDPTNGLRDLNSLIVNPPATWTPTDAVGVSQTGALIAGIGYSNISTAPPARERNMLFVLNGGSLTEIPDPGVSIYPRAISSAGEVAGFYFDSSERQHAFIYTPALGTLDIGTLGLSATGGYTPYTEAFGVNDLGVVAGSEGLADGSEYAFLWTKSGGMVEIEPPTGVVFDGTEGINNSGQVIIQGRYANEPALGYRGFVLTPVPEPPTLVLSASIVLFVLAVHRKRRRAPAMDGGRELRESHERVIENQTPRGQTLLSRREKGDNRPIGVQLRRVLLWVIRNYRTATAHFGSICAVAAKKTGGSTGLGNLEAHRPAKSSLACWPPRAVYFQSPGRTFASTLPGCGAFSICRGISNVSAAAANRSGAVPAHSAEASASNASSRGWRFPARLRLLYRATSSTGLTC